MCCGRETVDSLTKTVDSMSNEYTIYEIAKHLDIHPNTARKYAKESSVSGYLIKREGGGEVRLYTEDDFNAIQETVDSRVNRSESTGLAFSQVQEIVKQAVDSVAKESTAQVQAMLEEIGQNLAEFPEMRSQLEKVATHLDTLQADTKQREDTLIELMQANHEAAERRSAAQEAQLAELRSELSELKKPWWERWLRRERNEDG